MKFITPLRIILEKMYSWNEKGWQTCCILGFNMKTISWIDHFFLCNVIMKEKGIFEIVERLHRNFSHIPPHFSGWIKKNKSSRTPETKFILKKKVLTGCRCDISWVRSWKQNKWTFVGKCVCIKKFLLYLTKLYDIFDGIIMSTQDDRNGLYSLSQPLAPYVLYFCS